jgi:hypothetical protein
MMDDDLFAIPARARNTDPETSHKAAEAIEPHTATIRRQVEAFAHQRGDEGFIDEDLSRAFEAENVSSYRTRRAELADQNIILDSGRRRQNEGGRECVVWVHRSFVLQPPLERDPAKKPKRDEVEAAFVEIEKWQRQMKAEGRTAAGAFLEAIQTLRAAFR